MKRRPSIITTGILATAISLGFLSHYIYGHLNELGGLDRPQALFVASMGGKAPQEPTRFHSLEELDGRSISQIEADLKQWVPPVDTGTDFNPFFREIAQVSREHNLASAPITVMIITDGAPNASGAAITAGTQELYAKIDLQPLEHASRNVTVRLAYVSPKASWHWRAQVPRSHVRLWTVDTEVMNEWTTHLKPGMALHEQSTLWRWLHDDVEVHIRPNT